MFGQRLRLARRKADLTMRDLANKLEPPITAQAISKYEAGKMMPSSSVLIGLGRALGVSLDFLMGGPARSLKSLEWRRHSRASARDRAAAEVIVIQDLENCFAIEAILGLEEKVDLSANVRTTPIGDGEEVDSLARTLRMDWRLGIDPIPSVTALLEDKGFRVVEADLPEGIDGMACQVERTNHPTTQVVVVSRKTSVERKRFSLVHELAHQVMPSANGTSRERERAMNRFAGAFLVPEEHLLQLAGGTRSRVMPHEILQFKRIYGVSAAAMLVRLRQLGLLSPAAESRAFKTYARNWRRSEPEPVLDNEGFAMFERPQRFGRLVWQAVAERLIPPVRVAEMLRLPLREVEDKISGIGHR